MKHKHLHLHQHTQIHILIIPMGTIFLRTQLSDPITRHGTFLLLRRTQAATPSISQETPSLLTTHFNSTTTIQLQLITMTDYMPHLITLSSLLP